MKPLWKSKIITITFCLYKILSQVLNILSPQAWVPCPNTLQTESSNSAFTLFNDYSVLILFSANKGQQRAKQMPNVIMSLILNVSYSNNYYL